MAVVAALVLAATQSGSPDARQAATAPSRPVIAGVAHVAIQVTDLAKAQKF